MWPMKLGNIDRIQETHTHMIVRYMTTCRIKRRAFCNQFEVNTTILTEVMAKKLFLNFDLRITWPFPEDSNNLLLGEVTEDTNNLLLEEVTEDTNNLLLGEVTEDTNNLLLGRLLKIAMTSCWERLLKIPITFCWGRMPGWHSGLEWWLGSMLTNAL